MPLIIDPEFQALIPPLTDDERRGLEESILAEGCREKLIVWQKRIVDGHNRHEICTRHSFAYEITEKNFADRDEAKIWIIRNQFSRRNLTAMQRVELVIKLEPLLSAKAKERQRGSGGAVPQKSSEAPMETREELAKLAGVSHDTVSKVKKIQSSPVVELARMTREGAVSINAAAAVAELPVEKQTWVVDAGPEAVKEAAREVKQAKRDEREGGIAMEQERRTDQPKSRGCGLDWAHKAIALLQNIPPDDGLRKEALELVVRWCKHNAKESK